MIGLGRVSREEGEEEGEEGKSRCAGRGDERADVQEESLRRRRQLHII